ncbi:MAG: hypothetical protein HY820_10955 [Acidobacteria bacterium]|nr:hypothetical protein [Acidobacteriota bacterium]
MEGHTELEALAAKDIDRVKGLIRDVIREYDTLEKERSEPAYKTELADERRRREQLERRVNELVEENRKSRAMAEEAERQTMIRSELQKHGIVKLDLAFKAIKDEVVRTQEGKLIAQTSNGPLGIGEYVSQFVSENPEFVPARLSGGSGTSSHARNASQGHFEIEKIRPGMDPKELERIREEVARVALQGLQR